ncbi:radical SAM protein [Nocardia abscessus]|uniref:radical SAM protein n=1 Tax=Nocardia abscessus TaxID=120957 RepID=UPI002455C185|nr:radical SAM protein [Nocardia abscessus]
MSAPHPLVEDARRGPVPGIRLAWELTGGRDLPGERGRTGGFPRDPRELGTSECFALLDEFESIRVSAVEIGGGEPTARDDFWEIAAYASARGIGVEFTTDGIRVTPGAARRIARDGSILVRIRLDGATAAADDAVRGAGSYRAAVRAMELLSSSGVYEFELSVAVTRHNVARLDAFATIAAVFGARLRLIRPWHARWDPDSNPTAEQQRGLREWLRERGDQVRDESSVCPGGAATVVGRIDAIGEVFACTDHGELAAGNVRAPGGFGAIWRDRLTSASERVTPVPAGRPPA